MDKKLMTLRDAIRGAMQQGKHPSTPITTIKKGAISALID
jgi:hypothetical protein